MKEIENKILMLCFAKQIHDTKILFSLVRYFCLVKLITEGKVAAEIWDVNLYKLVFGLAKSSKANLQLFISASFIQSS